MDPIRFPLRNVHTSRIKELQTEAAQYVAAAKVCESRVNDIVTMLLATEHDTEQLVKDGWQVSLDKDAILCTPPEPRREDVASDGPAAPPE